MEAGPIIELLRAEWYSVRRVISPAARPDIRLSRALAPLAQLGELACIFMCLHRRSQPERGPSIKRNVYDETARLL
jgi:hypothetical protein